MQTTLFIGGVNVDLFEDEPILVDFSLTDVKEPASRRVSHTKTITLPNTPNNANIFKQLFVINKDNSISGFDPNIRVVAFVENGSGNCISGYFQLTKITKVNTNIKYEGVIYADEKNLFSQMGDSFIVDNPNPANNVDLDTGTTPVLWSYDAAYFSKTLANNFISSSREGQLFVIDNGSSTVTSSVYTLPKECLRMALKFKFIWDRIFAKYNTTYSSTFLNSTYFKTICYLDMHKTIPADNLYQYATINRSNNNVYQDFFVSPIILFDQEVADVGNRYNPANGRYTNTGNNKVFDIFTQVGVKSRIKFLTNYVAVSETATVSIKAVLNVDGFPYASLSNVVTQVFNLNGVYTTNQTIDFDISGLSPLLYQTIITTFINLNTNSYARIELQATVTTSGLAPLDVFVNVLGGSVFTVKPQSALIGYGEDYPKKGVIASQHKQKDFIIDILRMFNLYLLWDGVNYIIEPRDTFYTLGTELDWTQKVDRSQEISITPVGQLTWKQIQFMAKKDVDYYSDKYFTDNKEVYGQQNVFNQNEFITETQKVELSFAPPLSVSTQNAYPKIQHMYKLTNGVAEAIDGLPRYGYWGGWLEESLTTFKLTGGASTLIYNGYPFVGEGDNPVVQTLSVLYGPPKQVFYQYGGVVQLSDNDLYSAYYQNELLNQISANAKLITCYVYLTPLEINNLKLYDIVIVDGVKCLISKISDYNTTTIQPTMVELIQFIQ